MYNRFKLILLASVCICIQAYSQNQCRDFFDLHQIPLLTPVSGKAAVDRNQIAQLLDQWAIKDLHAETQAERDLVKSLKIEVESRLYDFFKNDPALSGAQHADIEFAVQTTLEKRIAAANDISVNHIAGIEFSRHALLLKNNRIVIEKENFNWQAALAQIQIHYLQHATGIDNVIPILRDGFLRPRPGAVGAGGDPRFVYFEPPHAERRRNRQHLTDPLNRKAIPWFILRTIRNGVTFLVSTDILQNSKWEHMNIGWFFGEFSRKFSAKSGNDIASMLNLIALDKEFNVGQFSPEFLFTDPIDLSKVDFRIIVNDPDKKEMIIEEATKAGIPDSIIRKIE